METKTAIDNFKKGLNGLLSDLANEIMPKPKNITDRVKTFDDALAIIGGPSNNLKILLDYNGIDPVLVGAKAMAKLQVIATALNEGWQPDWTNSNQYKYYAWFKMSGSGLSFHGAVLWHTVTLVGSRICFKSSELAEYAAEQFEDIYADFIA